MKPSVLLVGMFANRNWILGNWISEIAERGSLVYKKYWVPTVFGGKHALEKYLRIPFPKADIYFFSYPSIFREALQRITERVEQKSIVLYTHNDPELGSLDDQVSYLSKAFSIHFASPLDMKALVRAGLPIEKTRLAYGAIDDSCLIRSKHEPAIADVILASKFGERKGLRLLPQILSSLPEVSFLVLGNGWDEFIVEQKLRDFQNLDIRPFNKETRDSLMGRCKIFLSLSHLEGGPIPLIEAMHFGLVPIATDTGFSREFIRHGENGFLLPTYGSAEIAQKAILAAFSLCEYVTPSNVSHLTWNRIAELVDSDAIECFGGISA